MEYILLSSIAIIFINFILRSKKWGIMGIYYDVALWQATWWPAVLSKLLSVSEERHPRRGGGEGEDGACLLRLTD